MRVAILLAFAACLSAQQASLTLTPSVPDDQIQALLSARPEPALAAIIDGKGSRVITHEATATTLFDADAVAPTLAALLLQNMADSGEVALSDPAAKYLGPNTLPTHGKKQITLLDLATHTSGLPSNGPAPAQLAHKPGSKYAYSPSSIAFLADALARRANTDYKALLRTRILDPLGMKDTQFDGEGHLRSTADDLVKLLAAFMDHTESRLNQDMKALMKTRRPIANELETSLGWQVRKTRYCVRKGVCLMNQMYDLFTNEGDPNAPSFIGFDPRTRTGVVILSANSAGIANIGLYLLSPYAYPLPTRK